MNLRQRRNTKKLSILKDHKIIKLNVYDLKYTHVFSQHKLHPGGRDKFKMFFSTVPFVEATEHTRVQAVRQY